MTGARERQIIGGITALATLSRLQALFQPMRYDESVSWAHYIGRSYAVIAGTYQAPNNHVFFSLLARVASESAGAAPWALRLPALIAGIAIVPLTWLVGRRLADPRSGLLAAGLAAGVPTLILYSTNARGYSLLVALFLVMVIVADRLRTRASRELWMVFALIAALGLYTIPVMMYPFGSIATWLALDARTRAPRDRNAFLGALAIASTTAVALAGLLYLPIIRSSGISALTGNKFVAASSWAVFLKALPGMFLSTYASWTTPLPLWCAALLLVVALSGILKPFTTRPPLYVAVSVWCAALLVATHRVPFDRVWLFLLPLFLLAVARGAFVLMARLVRREVSTTLVVASVTGLLVAAEMVTHAAERNDDTGTFQEAEQVAQILAPRLQPTDRVLAPIPAFGPLLYYMARAHADTAMLTVPLEQAKRAFLVLDASRGQDLAWAVEHRMIFPRYFTEPVMVAKVGDATVWETHTR